MITLFSTFKPFRGRINIIQMNAIQSWLKLSPPCEIILFGNEDGTAKVADQFGIKHIPEVECTEFGTPLINALFREAERIATYEVICYINGDIILMNDFLKAVMLVQRKRTKFLIVGQRHDVNLTEAWDFSKSDWEYELLTYVNRYGVLHSPYGIDYFVFPRGQFPDLLPFAVGRAGWDNWLLYYTHLLDVPIIDASTVITAIHQNHDYSHYQNGREGVYKSGPEVKRHRMLMDNMKYTFSITDATWILDENGPRPLRPIERLCRQIEVGRSSVRDEPTLPPNAVLYLYIPRWLFKELLVNLLRYFRFFFNDRERAFNHKIEVTHILGKMYESFLLHSKKLHYRK